MLSSISPLGERARGSRWSVTATAYILGSVLGGLAVGVLAALLGGLVPAGWRGSGAGLVVLGLLLLLGVAVDTGLLRRPLPTWHRQVDVEWIGRYRGWVTGVGYGAQLGFGLVTIVTSSTTYAVVLLSAWTGSWPAGALVGATFGLVRALPLLLTRRFDRPEELHRAFGWLERRAGGAARFATTWLGISGVALLVVAGAAGAGRFL